MPKTVFFILCLMMIPIRGVINSGSRKGVIGDLREGLSYVRRSPALLALLFMAFAPVLFGMPYVMLLPLFAMEVFGVGSTGLGLLNTVTGVGALVGAVIIASLGDFRRKGTLLVVMGGVYWMAKV